MLVAFFNDVKNSFSSIVIHSLQAKIVKNEQMVLGYFLQHERDSHHSIFHGGLYAHSAGPDDG